MNYLHYDFKLGPRDVVEVELDHQANVCLLDDVQFRNYQQGRDYSYYGGLAQRSPVRLSPPISGHWNLTINLGGYPGKVSAAVRVISDQPSAGI